MASQYRNLESRHADYMAARSPAEIDHDATLTRFVNEKVGRYLVAEGYALTAWQIGPTFFVSAEMSGWKFTSAAFGLAIAEDHLLAQLTSAYSLPVA